jgi:hypothetical protein
MTVVYEVEVIHKPGQGPDVRKTFSWEDGALQTRRTLLEFDPRVLEVRITKVTYPTRGRITRKRL